MGLRIEDGDVALCDIDIPLPAVAVGMHHIDDAPQIDSRRSNPYKVVRIALSDVRVGSAVGVCS
jgi:hypothetical protein